MKHCSLGALLSIVLAAALLDSVALSGEMVFVPAGNFTMGSTTGYSDELPVHTVYLDAFYIDKYEVTNAQFKSCIDAGGCTSPYYWTTGEYHSGPAWPDFPVVGVSWDEAVAYANFVGKRLPTEAEWEKAARGTDQRTYPWGSNIDGSRANYSTSGDPYDNSSTPVGFYDGRLHLSPLFQTTDSPSPCGAYDMAGNVWEWVADWYGETYYSESPSSNPPGPLTGSLRVLRGGGWDSGRSFLRSAFRYSDSPNVRGDAFGFRCACSFPPGDVEQDPGVATFALEGVRPNPSHGERLSVAFTLPTAATARLELLDVSGRRVAEREVGSLGAGRHTIDFGQGQHLAPGLYLVRLTQGANTRTTRVAVIR